MTEHHDTFLEELRTCDCDPEQAELVGFHIAVRQIQLDTWHQLPPRPETIEPGQEFSNGVPLLPVDRLRIEPTLLGQAFDRIASLVAERRPQWAISTDIPYLALVGEWYRQGVLPDRTLSLIMQMALRPFLEREAQDILHVPGVDLNQWWRGWCPLCGGVPSFSALTPPGGERSLLCPRCLAQWPFSRVVCPFCGEDAASQLGYYPSADNAYRLYVCESCKGYIKAVDYRELARKISMPVLDILTADMDMAAVGQGYRERGGQIAYWAR
ncbi:MAG: formate dehydrogenase accessory protein FdhE [Chloroflexi bacterium]|nr:formate dehydrogenase accessory protein FdhE [Chloroflexota bacterium]MBU1750196.1 formate dehydrogenase accessory protein FdhE [Chloroflexota bacterium]MBU1879754.1 formate dehydrogenase accessory protein FdhE [Chloroflexota bacterium]